MSCSGRSRIWLKGVALSYLCHDGSWGLPGLEMKRSHFRSTKGKKSVGKTVFLLSLTLDLFFICEVNADYNSSQQTMPTKMLSGLVWLLSVLRMAMQTWGSVVGASCFWKAPCACWKCWYFMPVCISPFDPSLLCILSYYWYFPCLSILCHIPSSTATVLYLIKLWRKDKSLSFKCHGGKRS